MTCKQMMLDQMTQNLLDHERDSELMAVKLNQMKEDMMENEQEYGMRRKYGVVKTSGDRLTACTVSS